MDHLRYAEERERQKGQFSLLSQVGSLIGDFH